MEKVYNKLVRDRIPEIIKSNGGIPSIRELDNIEYKKELENKLKEEQNEVLSAATTKDRLEELADMLEVIYSLAVVEGAGEKELMNIMYQKREKRGGFEKRLFLEKVVEE